MKLRSSALQHKGIVGDDLPERAFLQRWPAVKQVKTLSLVLLLYNITHSSHLSSITNMFLRPTGDLLHSRHVQEPVEHSSILLLTN